MPINRVIINASPLICLDKSGLAYLLPTLFAEIAVPEEVCQEIQAKGKECLSDPKLLSADWLNRIPMIGIASQVAAWDLGQGESAVLSFALRNPEVWAIIDYREARRCALSFHCHFTGTAGVIVLAKRKGIISSIRESLEKLKSAGLWLAGDFLEKVCKKFGE